MSELEKLKNYLDEHGYISSWHDVHTPNDQIIVYTVYHGEPALIDQEYKAPWNFILNDGIWYIRSWDAVCHEYSYGGKEGLLEIYGDIVDDVAGWLSAQNIIDEYLTSEV